jgi:aspartyl-tRNA synthetase
LVMILTNQSSLREVILFPQLKEKWVLKDLLPGNILKGKSWFLLSISVALP